MTTKNTNATNINIRVLPTTIIERLVADVCATDTKLIEDDKFPTNETDKRKAYEDFRRKKYEYYERKHKDFPERDTPREISARKYNQWRTRKYTKIEKKQGLEKTKLCRSVTMGCKCKFGSRCNYAHSVEELVVPMCFFGKHCHCKRTCVFPHTEKERLKMQDEKRVYFKKQLESKQSIRNIPLFEKHNIIKQVATQTVLIVICRGFANAIVKRTLIPIIN